MPDSDPIRRAESLPSGADFYKCALQVNPHHYSETYRGQPQTLDADAYADAILAKAIENGISVLAITDHNNVNGIDALRAKANVQKIQLFPGFELSSSEGVHVLCLYPQDTQEDQLGRYLGQFGIHNTGPSADLANATFTDMLRIVREQRGIAVAAHATNANGLFEVMDGQARVKAWRDRNLMAIQIPGKIDDLPQDVRQIVLNKNPDYHRRPGASDGLPIAILNAKDVATPDDLADPSASCWIKMSEVSIEGLRQAFLDPDSRIRLNSDPVPEEHSELVAMSWEGGFLDGTAVHFNTNLNVLVGGRGTGKSTIIESLRYILGLDTIGDDARKAHEGIVRYVLRSGTKISLLVRSYRPSKREYLIERTIPNPPVVRTDTGEVSNLLPQDVLPRVEVYGQHEISEVTRSPEKLTRLLDRFIERDESAERRKSELRRELEKNRRNVLDVQAELTQIEERLAALPGLEETLKQFQDAGLESRLREQSLIVREERVLNTVNERIKPFRECLANLRRELPIDNAFLSAKALEELPGKEILAGASSVLDQLGRDVEEAARVLEEAIQRADSSMVEVRKQWDARKKEVQAAYEKILRELQKSRVDGEEFIRLRRQIEELRPLRERKALLQRTQKEHATRRRELLTQWEDIKAEEVRALDRAAKRVSKKLRDRVDVQVTASGDREPLAEVLRNKVGGRLSEAIDALSNTPDLSLPALVKACQEGATAVAKGFGIPPAQADRLTKASPDVLMQIEELELPAATTIKLNTAPLGTPPAWQALNELSTGQKATAVLLLLLLESDSPLIVDQPEDDLDNRFITEGVVPRMRDEKRRRQFVFSTHNANIPVLGDAELILGLKAQGEAEHGTAKVPAEYMGSIDSKQVRELVEEILEGGREAFEMRRLKYGF
jgi:PHP family Zn ribbon phosphoesterase